LSQSEDLRLILISKGSNLLVGKRVHLIQKTAGGSNPKKVFVYLFNLVLFALIFEQV
jgi:hypothetical protein